MTRDFEALLIEQCAPALAGIKPANLFRYQAKEQAAFRQELLRVARELAPFGLAIRILKTCPQTGASLIYLYRAEWLRRILAEPEHLKFRRENGYTTERGCSGLLEQLSGRLCLEQEFPHEIGVFLGYPLEDVVGFIEHRGRNFTCCGHWKAYGDPEEAQRRFEAYRQCTAAYIERFRNGGTISQLIAA